MTQKGVATYDEALKDLQGHVEEALTEFMHRERDESKCICCGRARRFRILTVAFQDFGPSEAWAWRVTGWQWTEQDWARISCDNERTKVVCPECTEKKVKPLINKLVS